MFGAKARSCTGSVKVEKVSTNCQAHGRSGQCLGQRQDHAQGPSKLRKSPPTATFAPPVPELSSEPTAIIGLCSLDNDGFQEMQEQGSFTCISSLGLHWDKFMTS